MFYLNNKFQRYFDTLRLHVRLVRAVSEAHGDPKCFTHSSCDSPQIDFGQVLSKGLHLDF